MAIAERELDKPKVLTYEDYIAEGETPGRYEIIDGVRYSMTSPHDYHQDIVLNIADAFRQYQKSYGSAKAVVAPVDIVTNLDPLKVRQPDVLLISRERYGTRKPFDKAPWPTAPELVVEVLSPTETKTGIMKKLIEYASVSVRECWLAYPETQRIEVWNIAFDNEPALAGTYRTGDSFASLAFPDLIMNVDSIFED